MALQFTPWSDFELNQLKELAGHFPASYISEKIEGRSVEGIRKMIKKQGLNSFVTTPPKPRPVAARKPVGETKELKTVQPKPKTPVAPIKPVTVRKASVSHISYPPLEWCMNCSSPVSNWSDHESRMSHMGCKRPEA